jgi:hypothetical protein
MDAVQKTGIYWKLKEEALERTQWTTALEEATDLLDIIITVWDGKIEKKYMGGAGSIYGGKKTYKGFCGESYDKRPFGRPTHRWEHNIKIHLQEMVCGGMNWIDLARKRNRWQAYVNAVMNLRVP